MFNENKKIISTINKTDPVYQTEELPSRKKRFGNFMFGHWRAFAFVVGIAIFAAVTVATSGAAALIAAIVNVNFTVVNVLLVWAALLLGSGLIFRKHRKEAMHENKMVRMQNKIKRNEKKFERNLNLYKGQLLIGNRELNRCKNADPKHKARFARYAYKEYKRHRTSMNYYLDRMLKIAKNSQKITDTKMPHLLNKMEFYEDKYARVRNDAQYGVYQMMNGLNTVVPQTQTFDHDISKQLSNRNFIYRNMANRMENRGKTETYDFALYRADKNHARFDKFDSMRRNYVPMDVDTYETTIAKANKSEKETLFADSTLKDELKKERIAVKKEKPEESTPVVTTQTPAPVVTETKEPVPTKQTEHVVKEVSTAPRLRRGVYANGIVDTGKRIYRVSDNSAETMAALDNRMSYEGRDSLKVKFTMDNGKADVKIIDLTKEPDSMIK